MDGKIRYLTPKKSLRKAHLRLKIASDEFDNFKEKLFELISLVDDAKDEEFNKNHIRDFLNNTLYQDYLINTKDKNDLAIYSTSKATSDISVLIETKRPNDTTGMVSTNNLNKKSLHQLILYYFRERVLKKDINIDIKHLIITDGFKWFIFNANEFEKRFVKHSKFKRLYENFEVNTDLFSKLGTSNFYDDAKILIEQNDLLKDLDYVYFNINEYKKANDDSKIVSLLKFLSPTHLLKQKIQNDNNTLNRNFYDELLYIIGLEEVKSNGKKIIQLKNQNHSSSIIQNTITQLKSSGRLQNIILSHYGKNEEEQLFHIALELTITWINRILFLKILEAKLQTIHQGDFDKFLSSSIIDDFDKLNYLFFQVLAKQKESRDTLNMIDEFKNIPYLNSSLFEQIPLEIKTIQINALRNDLFMKPIGSTVLKNEKDKKQTKELNSLEYFLDFLGAYNFGQYDNNEISDDKKILINASVLGLIFEKLNGYKDGSFYTPSFVTMYMSQETIRAKVLDKFNEHYNWSCKTFEELEDKEYDRTKANELINNITICDPAVGSGHFLVSVLNEILVIKSELKILEDENHRRIKDYKIEIENDELFIIDDDNEIFDYTLTNKGNIKNELQKVQKTIFEEKRKIIENQLFGVDLNPNSVKICSLRLWIELLKSTYYDENMDLVTLPNIDINIKCGNSLISRYDLEDKIKIKNIKNEIQNYKTIVKSYKHDKNISRVELQNSIQKLKDMFGLSLKASGKLYLIKEDKLLKYVQEFGLDNNLRNLGDDIILEALNLRDGRQLSLFGDEVIKKSKKQLNHTRLKELKNILRRIKDFEDDKIYDNAFEWRFEFPEVLDEDGEFIGFDIVIGNPPYFNIDTFGGGSSMLSYIPKTYPQIYMDKSDILFYFIFKALQISKSKTSFIISNAMLYSQKASKLRDYILEYYSIEKIINFEQYQVFEEASITSMMIFIDNKKSIDTKIKNFTKKNYIQKEISEQISKEQDFYNVEFKQKNIFSLADEKISKLNNKIDKSHKKLKDILYVGKGMETASNKQFIFKEYPSQFPNQFIKKRMSGDIIKKYFIGDFKEYLLYFEDIEEFEQLPASIQNYLLQHRKILENRADKKRRTSKWWNYTFPMHKDLYHLDKIWCSYRAKSNIFCFDNTKEYIGLTNTTVIFETNKNIKLKYILALLNSKILNFRYKTLGKQTGGGIFEYVPNAVEKLPIPNIPYMKPYIQNITYLLNLPKKEKYDKDTKYAIGSYDNKDIFTTEFLFAKQMGSVGKFNGHKELINYFKLLPYIFTNNTFDELLQNRDNHRFIHSLIVDENERIFHILDENNFLVSVYVVNKRNFYNQLNHKYKYVEKNLNERAAISSILSPAGPFWRHLDLLEQLYHILEKNTISQDGFIRIVDKIMQKKKINKNTIYLEKLIDKLVYQIYGLSDQDIEIIENNK